MTVQKRTHTYSHFTTHNYFLLVKGGGSGTGSVKLCRDLGQAPILPCLPQALLLQPHQQDWTLTQFLSVSIQ